MQARILICVVLLATGHTLVAQERPTDDINPVPSIRKTSHYIGLQANQLIRQLLSFGGNNSAITNPYALTYAANSKASGWGVSTGIGLASNQSKTSDLFTSTTSKVNDFAWRFGLEKKKYILRNWLVSVGADVIVEANKAETTTSNGANNPTTTITTTEKRRGFGPRVSLNYQFNDRFLIGTEASYYFKWIDHKQKTTGISAPNEPSSSLRSFAFTLPAVLFIIVKLD
jgi:hypothetical protein